MAPQRKKIPNSGFPLPYRFWGKSRKSTNHGKRISTDPPFAIIEIERTLAPFTKHHERSHLETTLVRGGFKLYHR